MKEKVYRGRRHNHDTISLIPKSSYLLSSFRGGRSMLTHLIDRRVGSRAFGGFFALPDSIHLVLDSS